MPTERRHKHAQVMEDAQVATHALVTGKAREGKGEKERERGGVMHCARTHVGGKRSHFFCPTTFADQLHTKQPKSMQRCHTTFHGSLLVCTTNKPVRL